MRSRYDRQLSMLQTELIDMGAICEEMISVVSLVLSGGNTGMLKKVYSLDEEIDKMEEKIESLCFRLILQQQPVAKDLRRISAVLKMITDMERIGDQAADIAEIIGFLGDRKISEDMYLKQMSEATILMVTQSIEAYVRGDLELANKVIQYDDVVDDYFKKVKMAIIDWIKQDKEDGEYALDLLMIAKYFERIGDHATNIAEWVVFSVTGEHKGVAEL